MWLTVVSAGCGGDGGPGELLAFIGLGPGVDVETRAVELGTDEASMLARDLRAGPDSPDRPDREVGAALRHQPDPGSTGYAFVLAGCRDTGARLVVTSTAISAELTGSDWDCAQAEYFLATFTVPDDDIPEGAVLQG